MEETAIGGPERDFPLTRWTLILSARERPETQRRALEELLGAYWKPLYVYVRRKGLSIEAAKDAVQGFFAHLLDRDFLSNLDPGKGLLRAYLKTALGHYLANEHERASAFKRGGGRALAPLDFEVAEDGRGDVSSGPDDAFDREWAAGVMERATARLREEFESGVRKGPFELVLRFFRFGEAPSYAQAARDHGMTVPQLKSFIHRARTRFRDFVRREVADTTADPGGVDAEIDELLRLLGP